MVWRVQVKAMDGKLLSSELPDYAAARGEGQEGAGPEGTGLNSTARLEVLHGHLAVVGLCRECKWWDVYVDQSYGLCQLTEVYSGTLDIEQPYPESKARAIPLDSDDAGAQLSTDPDFGCVQFSAKSGAEKPVAGGQ